MTRLPFLCIGLMLCVCTAKAAEIPVRSGAHQGFSRLVLDVPNDAQWTLEQDEREATIAIASHDDGFDVSGVFDRIDKSFISSVSSEPDVLRIAFSCQCSANVFRVGTDMIVIDVSNDDSVEIAATTNSQSFGLQFVGASQLSFDPINDPVEANELLSIQQVYNEDPTVPHVASPDVSNPSNDVDSASLRQAQEKLAERISFAATTGVLRPNRQVVALPGAEPRPQIDTQIFDSSLPPPSDETSTGPISGNLRISTSNDLPGNTLEDILDSTTLGVRCIDPKLVRVQEWGASSNFAVSVSNLRRKLYSEFDVLNVEIAEELARLYLHYGFGVEAKQVLLMTNQDDEQSSPLMSMSDIMEFGTARPGNHLENFKDCDSDVALWAILATDELQPSDTINSAAAIRTLSSLPLHLRRFLAPALSKKLLAYGDQDAAAAALRGLERTSEPLSPSGELAKANIDLAQGDVAIAQDRLQGVIQSNDQQSAEALIRYVETHLDEDVAIDNDIATLVEAYAIQYRDDPLGADLRQAHVLALAKSDQFDAAFTALDRMRPGGRSGPQDTLESSLLELLAKSADDPTFLRHTFEAITSRPEELPAQTKGLLGKRLVNLGFFGEAELLLAGDGGTPLSSTQRMLRARIAMGLSRPREALAHLGSIEGRDAEHLRANALAMAGEHRSAEELFSNVDADVEQLRSAWLSDDWQLLIEPTQPVLGTVVEIATSPLEVSADVSGMLGRTENALEESARAREAIQQLLSADPFQATSEN